MLHGYRLGLQPACIVLLEILYGRDKRVLAKCVPCLRSIESVGAARSSRTMLKASGCMTCTSPGAGSKVVAVRNLRREENRGGKEKTKMKFT